MSRPIESNIWKYYVLSFIFNFILIAPILIPFFVGVGLSATDIFILEAVFSLTILLCEIPSGYFADVFGRRISIVISAILVTAGMLIFALYSSFHAFLIAQIIWGLGASFSSGADSALLYDSLLQMKKKKKYKFHEGKAMFYMRLGAGISAIFGGLIFAMNFRMPFYLNVAIFLLLIPIALILVEPKRKTPIVKKGHFNEILKASKFCLKNKSLRLLILFSGLLFASMITAIWAYYLFYEQVGIDVVYFGILLAAFSLFGALGSKYAYKIEKKFGMKNSLLLIAIIPGLSLLLLGSFAHVLLIFLVFVNAFIWNFSIVLFKDYINSLTKSNIRATVLSVHGMFGRLFFVIIGPIFGWVIDLHSLDFALIILGLVLVSASLIIFYLFSKQDTPCTEA